MGSNDDLRYAQDDDRYDRTDRPVMARPTDEDAYRDRADEPPRDERYAGRGGSAYWQPGRGYTPERPPYSSQDYDPEAHLAASKRRHNVGSYGYGSDSYSTRSQGMADQNQGYVNQGRFGGHPGGYGHVGVYGPEGGAQNYGTQGWLGNQSWEGHQGPVQREPYAGGGGHRGKGPKNFQRTDERIREAVSEALEINDHVDASHIDVLVSNAEVTLSGTVDDRTQKRIAEDVVAAVSGVRDVQNLLKIPRDPRDPMPAPARVEHDTKKARA